MRRQSSRRRQHKSRFARAGSFGSWNMDQDSGRDAVDAVLLQMHESSQAESRSTQQTMQAVVYWTVAGAGAIAAFAATVAVADHGAWQWLAYLIVSVGWPLLAIMSGFYWLNEFARMLRAGLIGRRIECEILGRHPELSPHMLWEHALDVGVEEEGAGVHGLRLRTGYLVGSAVMMLAVLGGQGVVYYFWGLHGGLNLSPWVIAFQFVLLAAQLIAFALMGWLILRRFRPSCKPGCLGSTPR